MGRGAHRGTLRGGWLFIAGALALLLIGGTSSWAVLTVLRPAQDPLAATDHTFAEVVPGEVGSSLSLNTVAEWKPVPVGENRAIGVVTGVSVSPGDEVTQGDVLYSVGLRPVVIAQGDVPAFREIAERTVGPDVRQVQQMLVALGHYHLGVDGKAQAGTVAAIKRWQASLGLEKTGVIQPGDIIFVPALPTRVVLDAKVVHRGGSLSGGEPVLSGLPPAPVFGIPVTEAQASMIPPATRVDITSPEGTTWTGVTADAARDPDSSTVTVDVLGQDGGPVCGDECAQVPVSGQASMLSKIVTVETVSGLVVPSSALVTTVDGRTAVIGENGKRTTVTVVASAKGMSVVTGVAEGLKVRVPAKNDSGK